MLTRWADNPATNWTEYPRPQLVRPQWTSLNGHWHYSVRARTDGAPQSWDGQILVPYCLESPLGGVQGRLGPSQRLWYRRSFDLEDTSPRTLLHFGAVDDVAMIHVNGALVATHAGGFDAFHVDISDFVRPGANDLVVAVDDATSAGDQPRGKQHLKPQGIWYTPVSGIWQTVWLEQVHAEAHIEEVRIRAQGLGGEIAVEVMLARPTRSPLLAVDIRVRLQGAVVAGATARPDRTVIMRIPEPRRWSPDDPTLYDVDIRLVRIADPFPEAAAGEPTLQRHVPLRGPAEAALYAAAPTDGEVLDHVTTYFGIRTTAVGPHPDTGQPTLLLNGAPLFQLGTLDQGWWPDGLHTPPSDAAMVWELEFLKAAGFNTVRKHIKIEPARWYWHCDRLGLLVWQDMPSGFLPAQFVAPNDDAEGLRSHRSSERHELQLARMIRALAGHPSVVMWVLHNEGWGQYDSERLVALMRGLDPSRPIDAASGWLDVGAGDVIDRHDYAPEPAAPVPDGRRAPTIGEYGGIGWPIEGHLHDPDMRNWGYQTLHDAEAVRRAYMRTTAAIIRARDRDGVCGAIYTQTSDVEGEVNGLLTCDRAVEKLPRALLALTR